MVRDDDSATAPASGGGGIGLTPEEIEKRGNDVAALASEAQSAMTRIAQARGDAGAFGSYPTAVELFSHHQAVVGVFEETLGAITADIDDFGATIVRAARNHVQTDGNVLNTLTAITATVPSGTIGNHFMDARNNQGNQLANTVIDDPSQLEGNAHLNADAVAVLNGGEIDASGATPTISAGIDTGSDTGSSDGDQGLAFGENEPK